MDEIFHRGSCRHFKALTPVPEDQLRRLVAAGQQARSVGNQKSRSFIIVTREDLIKAIGHNSLVSGPALSAAACIVIVGEPENIPFPKEWTFDCAAAAQNILTEAAHLKLGTFWMQVYPYADRRVQLLQLLNIPGEKEPFCVIAVGYPAQDPIYINKQDPSMVFNDHYGEHKKG